MLDFLGDVGGLTDALRLICGTIVAFITQGSYMNRLVSLLFYYRDGGATKLSAVEPEDESTLEQKSLKERTGDAVIAA